MNETRRTITVIMLKSNIKKSTTVVIGTINCKKSLKLYPTTIKLTIEAAIHFRLSHDLTATDFYLCWQPFPFQ